MCGDDNIKIMITNDISTIINTHIFTIKYNAHKLSICAHIYLQYNKINKIMKQLLKSIYTYLQSNKQ